MSLSDLRRADQATLTVEVRPTPGTRHEVVVVPRGELDLSTVGILRQVVTDLPGRPARVVLDLSKVTFMDSMGVGLLVDLRRRFEPDLRELLLRDPSDRVHQVLQLTGLLEAFAQPDR